MDASSSITVFGVLCMGFLFLIFGGLGVWLILRHQKNREKARQSLNWPKTAGQVIESRIAEHESEDEDGRTTSTFSPVVRYEYQVGGVSYTGNRIGIGSTVAVSSRKQVEQKIAQYPAGKSVTVYYNSENPAEAVLETGVTGNAELIIGIILIVIGLSILCVGVGGILLNWLTS